VLYLHAGLTDTGFVEPLVCALQQVLVAPVLTRKLDLALKPEMRATRTQYDVDKVVNPFHQATLARTSSRTFKYLILRDDLKGEPFRYVFATSFGNQTTPFHIGIMSTARLQPAKRQTAPQQDAMITARRLYKLMLKSVARVAGYTEPEGCVLSFPRHLDELDRKPAEFCPEDRAALVAAGILKEKPDKGCSVEIAAADGAATGRGG
jgi:predicted Zn-dependent protease